MSADTLDYKIKGKTAIVTGAGKGIGRETSILLARQGAKVILVGRSMVSIGEVEKEIREFKSDVTALRCDVGLEEDVGEAVQQVISKYGRIDILVNNAGIEAERPPGMMDANMLLSTPVSEYHKVLDTNLIGHYNFMRACIPHMIKQNFGRIVNISSVTGFSGVAATAAYCASKAGSIVQTKSFARQFGEHNILINAIAPGMIDTPMHAKTPREEFDMVARVSPMRRVGQPIDVARVVLFLAQEDLYMTGETLVVDGGGQMR
jgi:3-oxoacyl-[acyl-carrier protein] reductase